MSFAQGMVVPTIPALTGAFDVSAGLAAQIVTAQSLGRTGFLLPAGVVIDRVGGRRAMMLGPLLIAVGAVVTVVTPFFGLLLAAQALTGCGASLWQMGREITAVSLVRSDQRGRLMSGFFGFGSLGLALGPLAGGLLTEALSFRAVFVLYVAIAAVLILVAVALPEQERGGPATRAPTSGRPYRTPAPTAARQPLLNIGRLSEVEPYYRATFVVIIFGTFADSMYRMVLNSLLPLYVVNQLGYTSTTVGTLFGLFGAINLLMIVPAGFISDKLGRRAANIPCAALQVLSFTLFPLSATLPLLYLATGLQSVAAGLGNGSKATYSYDVIPEHARGRLQALRRILGESGGLLGPFLGGIIADLFNPGAGFLACVPLQVASMLLMTFVAKESLRRPRPVPAG